MPKKAKERKRPGPKAERLAIEGDWRDAVRKALEVDRPPGGWPKEGENRDSDTDTSDEEDA